MANMPMRGHSHYLIIVLIIWYYSHTECDGKIVCAAFFAKIGRGEVDNRFLSRHKIAESFKRRFDPMFAFLHCSMGKATHVKLGSLTNINFNGNFAGVNPEHGTAECF